MNASVLSANPRGKLENSLPQISDAELRREYERTLRSLGSVEASVAAMGGGHTTDEVRFGKLAAEMQHRNLEL